MKKYLYKNIVLYMSFGKWSADYQDTEKRFGLHRCCCLTKARAYDIAKIEVDWLNKKSH